VRFLSSLDRSLLSSSFLSLSFRLLSRSLFFSNSFISSLRLFSCNALCSFSLLPSSTVDGLSSNRSSHVGFFSCLLVSFFNGCSSSFSVIVQSLSP
ncbi:hypothetical protein PRIPAC_73840, partial [Pristionchus pacificus]